jgi:hypothetical protein
MNVSRDQIKSTLRGLLSLVREKKILTSEELRKWGFELEEQIVGVSTNIGVIEAIRKTRIRAIQLLGKPAARALFDEEMSNICALIDEDNGIVNDGRYNTQHLAVTPFAVVRQEPVGHGGFHTGTLGTDRPFFRWVYDCGSWTKRAALHSRVDAFEQRCRLDESQNANIDLLFISHFDADHISGLGILLGHSGSPRLNVHTAVIPYLSPATGFAILAAAVAQGRCTDDLIDAVAKPTKYFAERLIQRLIIVRPRGSDSVAGDRAPRSSLPTLGAPPPSRRTTGRILSSEFLQPDGSLLPIRTQGDIELGEAFPGCVCGIIANDSAWADWWFVPHAHEWSASSQHLEETAKEIIGLYPDESGFDDKLIEKFRSPSELHRIRDMFRPMNTNGTSLSVYAGPPPNINNRISYGSPKDHPTGWLLTGDTPLKSKRRIAPWKESFRTVAKDIGQLMLPHHGAAKNFNSELLTFAPKAKCFATTNAEDDRKETRPPSSIRAEVGKRLTVVSEESEALIAYSGDPNLEKQYADGIRNW